MEFETRAIHTGQAPDPETGAVIVPIYQTSTFAQEAVGRFRYDYSRTANPTREALETCLASLESAEHGLAFASGMAAATTRDAPRLARASTSCRSTTSTAAPTGSSSEVYAPKGYSFDYVPAEEMGAGLAARLDERTRLVWVETPTNPFLRVVDLATAAEAAHAVGALLVVDNTFATPYLQRPLELGADLVLHSTTKYLGGHSDVVGGFVATGDDALAERLGFLQNSLGAVPGPFDSWLVLRGLKTLSLRMREHCANARQVAAFLDEHPAVARVHYPGLASHPGHEIAARQMHDFGGMVSFEVEGSREDALRVVERTRLFTLAESLGGVESLIEHPGLMTHASLAGSPFELPDTLIRLSVGIETAADLLADLEQALAGTALHAGGS